MWISNADIRSDGVHHVRLSEDERVLTFREICTLLQKDASFRNWFSDNLARVPMEAYFWETSPVTRSSFDRSFEYVLISAPSLAIQSADPSAFSDKFDATKADVVDFKNPNRDATLIAPLPVAGRAGYTHLKTFLCAAPGAQIGELWRVVGALVDENLSSSPLWLSTSGLGVPWLHIRLDSVPKYYNYTPYRSPPPS